MATPSPAASQGAATTAWWTLLALAGGHCRRGLVLGHLAGVQDAGAPRHRHRRPDRDGRQHDRERPPAGLRRARRPRLSQAADRHGRRGRGHRHPGSVGGALLPDHGCAGPGDERRLGGLPPLRHGRRGQPLAPARRLHDRRVPVGRIPRLCPLAVPVLGRLRVGAHPHAGHRAPAPRHGRGHRRGPAGPCRVPPAARCRVADAARPPGLSRPALRRPDVRERGQHLAHLPAARPAGLASRRAVDGPRRRPLRLDRGRLSCRSSRRARPRIAGARAACSCSPT